MTHERNASFVFGASSKKFSGNVTRTRLMRLLGDVQTQGQGPGYELEAYGDKFQRRQEHTDASDNGRRRMW